MTTERRYLNLNVYLRNSGYHEAAWRVSPADPAGVLDSRHYINLAKTAERGILDSIFLPDSPGVAEFRSEFLPGAGLDPLQLLSSMAAEDPSATFRVIAQQLSALPGGLDFTGTPENLAQLMIDWHEAGACDGFTLMPNVLPDQLAAFVDHVVPILQKRDMARTEYDGTTLRDHVGLPRPAGQRVG